MFKNAERVMVVMRRTNGKNVGQWSRHRFPVISLYFISCLPTGRDHRTPHQYDALGHGERCFICTIRHPDNLSALIGARRWISAVGMRRHRGAG